LEGPEDKHFAVGRRKLTVILPRDKGEGRERTFRGERTRRKRKTSEGTVGFRCVTKFDWGTKDLNSYGEDADLRV